MIQFSFIHRQFKFGHAVLCRMTAVLLGVALVMVFSNDASAQWIKNKETDLTGPYVDGEPFDLIYLNEQGENAILKIVPLKEFPTKPYPERGTLVFSFPTESDDKYEVPYSSVENLESFNDLLLEEANRWIGKKEFAKAFRNLFFIYNRGGKNDPKMVESLMSCLFLDGKENFESGEYELALSIYEDIYSNNPGFKVDGINLPLVDIVMSCHNGIIKKRFEKEDYIGVRKSLESVVATYGDKAEKLNKEWSANFLQRSDDLIAQSRQFAAAGKGREAHLAANQAEQMSPDRDVVLQLKKELLQQFAMIVTAVSQGSAKPDPNRNEHWGARRVGRLTQRTVFENTGLTDEGGDFEFRNGSIYPADEIGLKYTMEILENPGGFAVPDLDAYQLATRLLSYSQPKSPNYKTSWAKIFKDVEIEGQNRVTFHLRTPFVRPEALMKFTYGDPDENGKPEQNGPYVMTSEEKDITTFELNPRYPRIEGRQHPVIVEEVFKDSSVAADQLIAGNVDVVDRVAIADLKRLRAAPNVKVRPYILPTVHMLVPKIRGDAAKDPSFRNGLSHAIDRRLLVNDVICGGVPVNGCDELSGPFPIGTAENDQIAYGYDMKVRPLPFNSQMGMVMIDLALRAQPPVRPDPIKTPNLVIAHTNSSTARNAAAAIARMWTEVGVETSTVEMKDGESVPSDDEWDFLYLEIMMEEPLADAADVIGVEGFAKDVSAPIEQTLRNLSYARTWQAACADLRRLHRQTAVDLSVIPLWQVKEHYAYRTTVREIGRDLIHLYQNVDRWRIDVTAEEEQ